MAFCKKPFVNGFCHKQVGVMFYGTHLVMLRHTFHREDPYQTGIRRGVFNRFPFEGGQLPTSARLPVPVLVREYFDQKYHGYQESKSTSLST
jgi:hypothetical protein